MQDEHRYSEEEIQAIFEQAAEAQEEAQSQLSHGAGLTIAELQQIGLEAGISAEFIAQAAANVRGKGGRPQTSDVLGFPIRVEHSIELPKALSDDEWELLVADLRQTFRASGSVRQHGSLREWRNGNLHVRVEPSASGQRLHMQTRKGNAGQSLMGGSIFVAIGLMFLIIRLATGDLHLDADSLFVGMLTLAGMGMIGFTRASLPIWAKEREKQMRDVAKRTLERLGTKAEALEAPLQPKATPEIDLDALPDSEDRGQDLTQRRERA